MHFFRSFLVLVALTSPALAQPPTWQVPTDTVPYGKGAGKSGFGAVANSGSGSKCLTNTAPPTFQDCIVSTSPLGVANGGTGADLSATGGASQVLKQNSAGAAVTVGQLASTNLSDTTAATTWVPTDASGASLSFTSPTGNYSKTNKTCVGTLRVTYPSTANGNIAGIVAPCTLANNGNMAVGVCYTTSATANLAHLVVVMGANTATMTFVNLAGSAGQPTNANLTTVTVSCNFAFITT